MKYPIIEERKKTIFNFFFEEVLKEKKVKETAWISIPTEPGIEGKIIFNSRYGIYGLYIKDKNDSKKFSYDHLEKFLDWRKELMEKF